MLPPSHASVLAQRSDERPRRLAIRPRPRRRTVLGVFAAILALAVVAVLFVRIRPEAPEVVHESASVLDDLEDPALGERSDLEVLREDVGPNLVRHNDHVLAMTPDGVEGIDAADGSTRWSFEVPGADPTVGATEDGAVVVTHTVPLRWGREALHETVLDLRTGAVGHEEQLPVGAETEPGLGSEELRVLTDGTVRGEWRGLGPGDEEPWEVDPAGWCPDGDTDRDASFSQYEGDLYMAVVCAESDEGTLVALSPDDGSVTWEEPFASVGRAPELLELSVELARGMEHDPVARAADGEFGAYRYVELSFGRYPEELDQIEILRDHVSLPTQDPSEPVEAFIIGEPEHLVAHLLHSVVGTLLDEGVLAPDDLDADAFKDGSEDELHTMYDDMAFYSLVTQGQLLDALETLEG